MFVLLDARRQPAGERAPLAAPMVQPRIEGGRIASDRELPQPSMLVDEPTALDEFRKREDAILHGYGWSDETGGTARIPVERAKEILLKKGFPTRQATPPADRCRRDQEMKVRTRRRRLRPLHAPASAAPAARAAVAAEVRTAAGQGRERADSHPQGSRDRPEARRPAAARSHVRGRKRQRREVRRSVRAIGRSCSRSSTTSARCCARRS